MLSAITWDSEITERRLRMFDWFRSWHGAPTDLKWLVIAKHANTTPGVVSAIVWALLDHASQVEERGDVSGFNCETYAAFSGFEEDTVRAVFSAMQAKHIIVDGRIAQWEKRQPKREDSSSGRVREHREKNRKHASKTPPSDDAPPAAPAQSSATESKPTPEVLISPEALNLADEIAVAAGHELEFVPPAWCGAAYRVQTWISAGWQPQLILQSVKAQMQRKRDGPPDRVQYFEKGIARAIAEHAQPLPNVIPLSAVTIEARHGKATSAITAAADRLIAELESGGGQMRQVDPGLLSDGRRQ
jgi:hypothetical protein